MTDKAKVPLRTVKRVSLKDAKNANGKPENAGGSRYDQWNDTLFSQAVQSLWTGNSTEEKYDRQLNATVAALRGIGPQDELEGMMAAQLVAAHNTSMKYYRRAMIQNQTFEGRRENLNQANKLSRTCTLLYDALNKHRGKGQQRITVEHVHVHDGGQAVVGHVEGPGGGGMRKNAE
ncbi:MAG: hypothetical protein AAGI88_23755 [Pseudomonadota bacterium]